MSSRKSYALLLLFESESQESVRRVVAHAELACDGFVQTLSSSDPREVEL